MNEPRKLTPANENPWYVLMTLFGEQEGDQVDRKTANLNRNAWNCWATKEISQESLSVLPCEISDEIGKCTEWNVRRKEIEELHHREMVARNHAGFAYPGFPDSTQTIRLSKCCFEKRLALTGFIFPTDVHFNNALFEGNVIFNRTVYFQKLTLSGAQFARRFYLSKATCIGPVVMNRAKFEGNLHVQGSIFQFSANFHSAKFGGSVSFDGSVFGRDVACKRDNDIGCKVEFSNSSFEGRTSFRNVAFRTDFPTFRNSSLNALTDFTAAREFWPRTTAQDPAVAKESCAMIRHAVGKRGLPEEEHFFFRREMHFASQIGGWWQRLPYRLYGVFSNYGESIGRPVRALAEIFGFGAIVLFGHFLASKGVLASLGLALSLSFSNLLPLFGFGRTYLRDTLLELPWYLQALSAAQTVFALPLLFFLGLGLRKRFRLR